MLTPFPSEPFEQDDAPIIRIINTILAYAIKDGTREIHIFPTPKAVVLSFRSSEDDEWKEQMKIPVYILNPLLKELEAMIPEDKPLEIILQAQPPRFALEYTVSRIPLETEHGAGVSLALRSGLRL